MARILVADDDPAQLNLRKAILEAGGHEVDVALSPATASAFLEHSCADLILMDLRFANAAGTQDAEEGLALIRRIREIGCQSPAIVLSGWPEELYGRPEEKMVSRVLIKPISMAVLLQAIQELL
jgi:CheY-like chemotaxis protein